MLSNFSILKIIGRGSYGTVYKVEDKRNNGKYAMKKIKIDGITPYEKNNIINELRVLSTHKCPFIVRFKSAFVYLNNIYIITEYAEKGDLAGLIQEKISTKTNFEEHVIPLPTGP